MFEGIVASLLNRYLGKYIEDLDLENLNVGIFSGNVLLSNLKLKTEALYELGFPIEVKAGSVGKFNINIPWNGLSNQPIVIKIEEILIITGHVLDREWDTELEKRLMRAMKKNILEKIESTSIFGSGPMENGGFIETLMTTVMNNLQIFIRGIHVRFEDTISNVDSPRALGLCVQSISLETTNSKWKPILSQQRGQSSVYQIVKIDSASVYCNTLCSNLLYNNKTVVSNWQEKMRSALNNFNIDEEPLEFVLKPVVLKVKIIVNKSNEARVPKLLVDFVLQDAALQLSRKQFVSLMEIAEFMKLAEINRSFRDIRPRAGVVKNAKNWWSYAYKCVLRQRATMYWQKIKTHRKNFRSYINAYKKVLVNPNDTELKLDLQMLEDELDIFNLVLAREQAKIELCEKNPESVTIQEFESKWWGLTNAKPLYRLCLTCDKGKTFWNLLSQSEKDRLNDLLGRAEGADVIRVATPKQYIEHKINLTVANCLMSLISGSNELMVITVGHLMSSLETRPSAKAYKISTRVESINVEASVEYSLVPIIDTCTMRDNSSKYFLSVDFEKNPLNSDAEYGLSVTSELAEIVYHEFALSALLSFFYYNQKINIENLVKNVYDYIAEMVENVFKSNRPESKYKKMLLNLDLQLPYIVIPEFGSIQKCENVMILDFGAIKIKSDLQPDAICLDDVTQMEMEEKLYDRYHIDVDGSQMIFCNSENDWRTLKTQADSSSHIVSKTVTQIVISNSIKPEYKQLAKRKVNISVQSIKLNLSDHKISSILDFIENTPLPTNHVSSATLKKRYSTGDEINTCDRIDLHNGEGELKALKSSLALYLKTKGVCVRSNEERVEVKKAFRNVERKSLVSSEMSDEEFAELWARTVDLPGFDDNVSPNNTITSLFRFVMGELSVNFHRSSDKAEKPYLNLTMKRFCCDVAVMEYGPAIQTSIGSISLSDVQHICKNNENVRLLWINPNAPTQDSINLLYRKVRASCPDFKSHFHSVEKSLVLDLNHVDIVCHRAAIITLYKYLQYVTLKFSNRRMCAALTVDNLKKRINDHFIDDDPPVPPGATKFSYSARITHINALVCDTGLDFLNVKAGGLESDCTFKANDRMVFRLYVMSTSVDDLSEVTLYPKLFYTDEDKLLEFKYVRHNPRLYKTDIETKKDDVKFDGSVKLHLGRVHVTVLCNVLLDFQYFVEPIIAEEILDFGRRLRGILAPYMPDLRNGWKSKIHLSICLNCPVVLFPQNSTSPNIILCNMGDLTIENFFKQQPQKDYDGLGVVDNVLAKWDALNVSRAIMTLDGNLVIQEPMVEPFSIRLDIKRNTTNELLYSINGGIDSVQINLGQKDFATFLHVWDENFESGRCIDEMATLLMPHMTEALEDNDLKKIQVFFNHEISVQEIDFKFCLDNVQIALFGNSDEILSSPIRDVNHSLCKLDMDEIHIKVEMYSNNRVAMNASIQKCVLEDTRRLNKSEKKIFDSVGPSDSAGEVHISVLTPPLFDLSFEKTCSGDKTMNIHLDKTRLNISVPFAVELSQFIFDSLPSKKKLSDDESLMSPTNRMDGRRKYRYERPLAEKKSLNVIKQSALTISVRFGRPEIAILPPETEELDYRDQALLCKTEFLLDYSRHPGHEEALVFSLSNFHVLAVSSKRKAQKMVLHPCDIELSRTINSGDRDAVDILFRSSPLNLNLSTSTIHIILNVVDYIELNCEEDVDFGGSSYWEYKTEDLWTPKSITPSYSPSAAAAKNPVLWFLHSKSSDSIDVKSENLEIYAQDIHVSLEVEELDLEDVPIINLKSSLKMQIKDWSDQLRLNGSFNLRALYYNCDLRVWEPLVEPWTITLKGFVGKCGDKQMDMGEMVRSSPSSIIDAETESSGDESEAEMKFIRKSVKSRETSLEKWYSDDSDSDNDTGVMDKLAKAVSHLISDDFSDEEITNTDSSDESIADHDIKQQKNDRTLKKKLSDSSDSGLENDSEELDSATCVVVEADRLEVSFTPASLSVLDTLVKSFYSPKNYDCDSTESFVLVNDLAVRSIVMLYQKSERGLEKILEAIDGSRTSSISRQSISNDCTFVSNMTRHCNLEDNDHKSTNTIYRNITDNQLNIKVEGFDDLIVVCPKRTCNKLHALRPVKNDTRYWIMVCVVSNKLCYTITIRSPLMLKNDTSYPLMVHYNRTEAMDAFEMDSAVIGESDNPFEAICTATILDAGSVYNVPIALAYHSKLYLSPANLQNYFVSDTGVWWPEMAVDTNPAKDLVCATSKPDEQLAFSVRVVCEEGEPVFNRASRAVPNYTFRAVPPVIMHNFLPFAIELNFPNFKHRIEASEKIDVYELNLTHRILKTELVVPSYLGISWSGTFNLRKDLNEKTVNMSTEHDTDGGNKHLKIAVRVTNEDSCRIFIHSPYWIVNKTGLPLQLRGSRSDIVYESHSEEPLLFSYKRMKKRNIKLRAYHSSWSSAFSMDTVYCPGLVVCKDKERQKKYRILMKPVLSHLCPHLTTIVTYLPNFSVANNSSRSLRFMEDNPEADLWTDVLQGQTLPFWPETDSMRMFVKFRDSKSGSQHFSIIREQQTVLRMDRGRALVVKVTGGGDNPFLISFHKFRQNDAPVRIDNVCEDMFLKIHQKDLGQVTLLSPNQSVLYTWDDPTEQRVLYWNVYSKKSKGFVAKFEKEGYGQETLSFCQVKPPEAGNNNLNLMKLITSQSQEPSDTSSIEDSDSDEPRAKLTKTRKAKIVVYWVSYVEVGGQRVLLFTQDEKTASVARKKIQTSHSCVDSVMSIKGVGLSLSTSRGVHTEEIAYASLSDSASEWMVKVGNVWKPFTVELACWLEDMWENHNKRAHLKDYVHVDFDKMQMIKPFFGQLRRLYNPAVWSRCKVTTKNTVFQLKVHRIQVDNQLSDCTFKTALYPTPSSKTSSLLLRPCVEIGYSKTTVSCHYDVYKYFNIRFRDFTVQLDRTFVVKMHKTLSPLLAVFERPLDARFRQDVSSLHASNMPPGKKSGRTYIESFDCSPCHVHLSFSAKVADHCPLKGSNSFTTDALLYVLDGHANRLSDMKTVSLDLNGLTRKGIHKESFESIFSYGWKHYARQLLKQSHVYIFNSDVLENVYEANDERPDASESPENHLGTLCCDSQHEAFAATVERQEKWGFTESLPERALAAYKGTEMSVLLSMSGAIQRPHIGGEDDGAAESFFRGPGRNLLAVLSKSNVSDKVSMAYDGVKRVIESGEEVVLRTRLPRYINPMGMKSYSSYEAVGQHLFRLLSRMPSNDGYWAHVSFMPEGKKILLITLRRVILAEKCRTKGPWEIEWSVYVDNITEVPKIEDKKLTFKIRQDENHSSYFFRGDEKRVEYDDKATLKWIKDKIEQVMMLSYEDSPMK
ncbi:intermembrane lipid transfer protein VPS13A-like isoform X2 [Adelges cooleyi]|uniref:intermembrane lipid transfer protein VPS13A-like isoform X2 n=1 Tax=Adelges cooleyi TaxID=133065 RepID=UPI00217FBA55|nr:intermembrane lipid transfer protein VPS13A-like isoform X2 [Adelges cooleyi]